MKITLRKANAVQNAINEALKNLDLSTEVQVNEFENAAEKLAEANEKFTENFNVRTSLVDALYEIRRSVANANAQAGINDLLTEVAKLEKQIGFYTRLGNMKEAMALSVIEGKLERFGKMEGRDLYYRDEDVTTGIFDKAEIAEFANNAKMLKKAKQNLQDQLLELNVRTEILLSDETASFLEEQSIL